MSRITLEDTKMDAMVKMAEGNPGAITALIDMVKQGPEIDPQCADGILKILMLDDWEIYGSNIWILYKDKCGMDTRKMIMLIRAAQMGKISVSDVVALAHDECHEVNLTDEEWADIEAFVCGKLEQFSRK